MNPAVILIFENTLSECINNMSAAAGGLNAFCGSHRLVTQLIAIPELSSEN